MRKEEGLRGIGEVGKGGKEKDKGELEIVEGGGQRRKAGVGGRGKGSCCRYV